MDTNERRPSEEPKKSPAGNVNRPSNQEFKPTPTPLPSKDESKNSMHSAESWRTEGAIHETKTAEEKERYTRETRSTRNSFEDRAKEGFEDLKQSDLYMYVQRHPEQILTYVLLALGIILLFTFDFYLLGGLLVGGIAGYHFAPEIIYYLQNINRIFVGHNRLRYIVLTGLLLGILISAPGIFIGAFVIAAFTQVFSRKDSGRRESSK